MKKFLSLLLVLVMVLSLSVATLAEEATTYEASSTGIADHRDFEKGYTQSDFDVKANYSLSEGMAYTKIVYAAEIAWSYEAPPILVKSVAGEYMWDTTMLAYIRAGNPAGDTEQISFDEKVLEKPVEIPVIITFKNLSNAPLYPTIEYQDKATEFVASEKTAEDSMAKTGETLDAADKNFTKTSDIDVEDYDFAITIESNKTGTATTATYNGIVTITEITEAGKAKVTTDSQLATLGNYTVKLYTEAPTTPAA